MVMLTILLRKLMCQLTSKYLDLFLFSGRCKYCVNINNVIIDDIINTINIINIIMTMFRIIIIQVSLSALLLLLLLLSLSVFILP